MAGEAMSAYVRFFVRDEVSDEAGNVERAARDAAAGMDEAADAAGNRMAKAFGDARGHAANFAKGLAGVAAGAGAFIGGMIGFANETAEFQEAMGKLETAFSDTGQSAETAKGVYNDFVGIMGEADTAVEASAHLAELTSNAKELSDWGTIAAGVTAKFGESLPLEGLTEAANHTAKLGEVQGALADALEWAGMSSDEFNKQLAACNSEEERASLITSTLNEIYGEAGQAYKENNADLIAQRQAQSDLNAALTSLGNLIRPLVADIIGFGASLAEKLQPYVKWFIDNLPTITPIVAGIAAAFLAYSGISALVSGISAVMTVLRSKTLLMAAAQGVLNAVMNLNPFVLIATLIAGLVTAFIVAYNTSDTFRAKVNAAFSKVKEIVSGVVSSVKSAISSLVSSLGSAFNAVKTAIDKIKGVFNFSWSLPKPKLPRFSVSGGKAPWGFMGQGSLPRVSVEWMANGGIFSQPTLFATDSGFKGVGEAGAEAVAPISVLMDYVRQAVSEAKGGGYVANISVTTGETDERKLARMIAREEKRQAYALGAI